MTPKRKTLLGLLGIAVLTLVTLLLAIPGGPDLRIGQKRFDIRLRLGLDLLGGTQLTYGANMEGVAPADQSDALQGVRDVIERRVNPFGIAENLVQTTGGGAGGRILVELPGVQNADEAIRIIGETPQLDFREEGETTPDGEVRWTPTKLTGRNLKRAEVSFQQQTSTPEVALTFDGEGTKLFGEITERNVGKRIAIFLDGLPITAPVVQDKITQGEAVITGNFTLQEAKQLATRLRAGALPVPISLESRTTVGPSLGKDSLGRSIIAGVLGLILILVYMVVLYRFSGLVAAFALLLYALLNLAAYKLLGVTLTLAGAAGFILSIGMAVDANILIFERLKEELRRSRPLLPAISDAFREAWTSIRDSNVSSLITCVLLYALGSSLVRGFALTLGIGIVLSMFSAITVTRTLLRATAMTRGLSRPRWYAPGASVLSP